MELTQKEEQLLALGDASEALLADPTFNQVINALVEQAYTTFVNTQLDAEKSRERVYNHYRAVVDVVGTLRHWVSVRDEITLRHEDGDNRQEESDHE
jgi:hypothetical protein